ncbi:trk system potassium uptake protein TrkA [Desulfomicrobium apsheronum]|uniref:Trk system potassium uptake protein TrkA n=1 Tax=Desulfomicrobium apsheronum TaxID=52560 RepID=A0A1I3WUW3_9BACT|nr:TrkA family potassium uptake protein [Desulfomicrobium apsheronum]MDY0226782.1 TrkA family potassium uptake protein [Desulfomicrobium apsheronum]SFK11090.1 trk system potassium uptake protein TrkA [Desulfomicrobium apsheronum]
MARREFGVVGLGKFGLSLAKSLMTHGQTVVGVDSDPEKVKAASEVLTHAYQAEAVDKVALEQLGFGELPSVIVSTGHSMEASILITLFLKELGCKSVTVKAMSRDHEKVLIKVGADAVIFPERFAAEQLAAKLAVPGLIDYLPLGTNVILKEIIVEDWAGKTLRDLDLTNTIGIQVVAVKRLEEKQFVFVPKADEPLQKGDVLAVIGHGEELLDLDS